MITKYSTSRKLFIFFTYTFLSIFALLAVYPLIYVFSASISNPSEVVRGNVILFPKGFDLGAYKIVMAMKEIGGAYLNTIFYAVVGVSVNMIITIFGAYALSKKRLVGRKFFVLIALVTMWFNAGIIPFYLNYKKLGLYDTRMGIVLAFACSAFYFIILRTYFESLPEALEESARIEGANDFQILFKVILPLSKPALFTICFYYLIDRWNGYFWSMMLLKSQNKLPIQVVLKKMIVDLKITSEHGDIGNLMYQNETVVYALVMVAVIPMLLIYPIVFNYFKSGVMVGAVKE